MCSEASIVSSGCFCWSSNSCAFKPLKKVWREVLFLFGGCNSSILSKNVAGVSRLIHRLPPQHIMCFILCFFHWFGFVVYSSLVFGLGLRLSDIVVAGDRLPNHLCLSCRQESSRISTICNFLLMTDILSRMFPAKKCPLGHKRISIADLMFFIVQFYSYLIELV